MNHKFLILILLFLVAGSTSAQNINGEPDRLSLLFIGDIMGHDEQIRSAENSDTKSYNYDDVFSYVREEISEADYAIANFEVTLAGAPYKGYPAFSSPVELAVACAKAGIDCFVTANNHSADRGKKGILKTLHRLDSLGIPHTGTFADKSERDSVYPLMLNIKGNSVALLNYTYGTNGINVPDPVKVNMLSRDLVAEDLDKAVQKQADLIILFLHWGTEYDTIPSKEQEEMARFFFSRGADLIIGSHPHVLQKMIWVKKNSGNKDQVTVYSLGNYVSNQRRLKTDGGAMVRIEFEKNNETLIVSNAGYYLTWVYTPVENFRKRFLILPCSKFENNRYFFSNPADYQKMMTFLSGSRRFLETQNINFREFIFSGSDWNR
ncbi:MAG: CapA family protein [Bacteroidales bacterium]|nr:CapA family protein [Bacteroidales bacterium]